MNIMLNEHQVKQFKNMARIMEQHPEWEIGTVLGNAYFKKIDKEAFANKALEFANVRENGVMPGVLYLPNPVEFYEENRSEIINWFDVYTKDTGHESTIDYMKDLMEDTLPSINIDTIGRIIYGQEKENKDYNLAVERLSVFVAENIACLFHEVVIRYDEHQIKLKQDTDEALQLEANTHQLKRFMADIDIGECHTVGFGLAKAFIDNIGNERFFIDCSVELDENHINNIIQKMSYPKNAKGIAYPANPVKFYEENRDDLIAWLGRYTKSIKEETVLNYLEKMMLSLEVKVFVDEIAQIVFGRSKINEHYHAVAVAIVGILAEQIAIAYNAFANTHNSYEEA